MKTTLRICIIFIIIAFPVLFMGASFFSKYSWGIGADTLRAVRHPVDIPMRLSGTLGEIRGYSLHSGIDIKTEGRTGFPVRAVANGAVTRIIARENGYGNAVFLDHGGMQTVSAHLNAFEDRRHYLDSLVAILRLLYNIDSIDITFRGGALSYSAGDIIAYTGESGAGLPHLHFEARNNGSFVNPMRLFPHGDSSPPVISALYVCVEKDGATISERMIGVKKRWGGYVTETPVIACGPGERLFFKIACHDTENAHNSVAVYRITVRADALKIFDITFDSFTGSDLKYGAGVYDISKSTIDGVVAYTYFLCRRAGNGFSGIDGAGSGYLIPGSGTQKITVDVLDYSGNTATLKFNISGTGAPSAAHGMTAIASARKCTVSDSSGRCTVTTAPGSLIADSSIKIEHVNARDMKATSGQDGLRDAVAALYAVRPFDTTYITPVAVSIAPPDGADITGMGMYHFFEGRKPKPLNARYNPRSRRFEASITTNGYVALIRDTWPPEFTMPPTHEFMEDSGMYTIIRVYAADSLSGVNAPSIRCIFDGEPYPFRYDNDRKWIEMAIPRAALPAGIHHIFIACPDNAGNTAIFRNLLKL